MNTSEIKAKTLNATKWSSVTELLAKIISPIINMILARILAPEAFGVLATINMIIAFADVFIESGFQNFLIQHEFKDEQEEHQYMDVAFWCNLILSLLIWLIIFIFRNSIAKFVGNGDVGNVIVIACGVVPLSAIIGIQNCIIKKKLEFKKLFFVRVPTSVVPLFVTIPLALLGFDYWALIIGNIVGTVIRSILLFVIGKYRPRFYFDFSKLLYMAKFGSITLLDGLAIWGTNWIDTLLIASTMTDYQLGLYKNSISLITNLFSIVTASITPVLFSSLSQLQNNQEEFNDMFIGTQKVLCTLLLPMGLGMFLYRDLVTKIILGDKWSEATMIVGLTAITLAVRTIFSSINSQAYRAKGKFAIPLLLQILDLALLVPTCILSARFGFETLVYSRSIIRLDLIIPGLILLYIICRINPITTLKKLLPCFFSSLVMCVCALLLQKISNTFLWSFLSIFICIIIYFSILCIFKSERKTIKEFARKFFKTKRAN